jgi:hypothetical protein
MPPQRPQERSAGRESCISYDCEGPGAMLNFAMRELRVRVRTVLSGNERLTITISRLIV